MRVRVTPPEVPEKFAVWGNLKTLHGVRVIEVHPGFYVRPDLNVTAVRYFKNQGTAGFSGWVVSSDKSQNSYSDPIPNKQEALLVLNEWEP
jgi:hypothetical protein